MFNFFKMLNFFDKKKSDKSSSARTNGEKMIVACENGELEIVLKLSDQTDVVNFRDDIGWCPIHYAAQSGNGDIIRVLANSNADLNVKTKEGYTAGHILISFFNRVRMAYQQGKIPKAQGLAMLQSTLACFQTLMNFNADVTIPDPDGITVRDFLQRIGAWHQN